MGDSGRRFVVTMVWCTQTIHLPSPSGAGADTWIDVLPIFAEGDPDFDSPPTLEGLKGTVERNRLCERIPKPQKSL